MYTPKTPDKCKRCGGGKPFGDRPGCIVCFKQPRLTLGPWKFEEHGRMNDLDYNQRKVVGGDPFRSISSAYSDGNWSVRIGDGYDCLMGQATDLESARKAADAKAIDYYDFPVLTPDQAIKLGGDAAIAARSRARYKLQEREDAGMSGERIDAYDRRSGAFCEVMSMGRSSWSCGGKLVGKWWAGLDDEKRGMVEDGSLIAMIHAEKSADFESKTLLMTHPRRVEFSNLSHEQIAAIRTGAPWPRVSLPAVHGDASREVYWQRQETFSYEPLAKTARAEAGLDVVTAWWTILSADARRMVDSGAAMVHMKRCLPFVHAIESNLRKIPFADLTPAQLAALDAGGEWPDR